MSTEVIYLGLLFLCIVFSAFFSASETAFMSLEQFRVESMLENKVKGALRVSWIKERPEKFLSTILFGNNLVNTAAAALGTTLAVSVWGESRGVAMATAGVTVVLLIFAEVVPKTFSSTHRERVAVSLARPVQLFAFLFAPVVAVLSWIARGFTRLLGGKPLHSAIVRPEDIQSMINVGHKAGTVDKSEAELLSNVFDFGDRPVSEVIVPRLEVISVSKSATLAEFLSIYADHPMSRFPVYEENMDNVVGVISLKDVVMAIARETVTRESPISDLVRPTYFVPETKSISDLFHEMRDKNYRMSVVIDEYGGTAGIVTLSGLMEEIVGPVGDELSAAEKDYEHINEYTFQVDGGMRVEELNSELGVEIPEGDYETIAGFILHKLGRFPKQGQQIKFGNLKIVVTKMKGMKIEEVLIAKEKTPVVKMNGEQESSGNSGKKAPK